MRVLCLALIVGCSGGGATLRIDLRTDFVPEDELVRVEVAIDDQIQTTTVTSELDWLAGGRIASFEVDGSVEARVTLVGRDEQTLAERTLRAEVGEDIGRTVVITRSCRAVACPEACVGGRCVSEECSPETPEACPEPDCTTDADCSAVAQCAVATCLDGRCYQAAGSCGLDEFCDPDSGCRLKSGGTPSCENPIDVTGLVGEHRFSTCGFADVGQGVCSPEGADDAFFTYVTPPNTVCSVRRDTRGTPVMQFVSFDGCGERDRCFDGFAHGVTSGNSETQTWFSVETEGGCGVVTLEFECTPR